MIESTENKVAYIVGSNNEYAFPIRFFNPEDIHCFVKDGDREFELINGTDFTVAVKDDYSKGSTITLKRVLALNTTLVIARSCDEKQLLALPEHGKLPSKAMEAALDKLMMIIQEHREVLKRCVTTTITSGQKPAEIIDMILNAKDISLDAASAATQANAAAAASLLSMQVIWAEITGNDASAQEAIEALKEAFEAAGSVTAAAEAGKASVNAASLAAIDYAKGQIEESKKASIEVLSATTQSRTNELLALVAETTGAEGAVTAAVTAAQKAASSAAASGESIDAAIAAAQASINAATNIAEEKRAAAAAAASEAATQAKTAGDSAAAAYSYIAETLANKNASALSALSAAESAASAGLSAQAAAGAAGTAAQTAAEKSISAHNVNIDAHKALFAKCISVSGGAFNVSTALTRTTDDSYLGIYGGTTASDGAGLELLGPNHSSMPGGFYLRARNGNSSAILTAKPTGELLWRGRNVALSVNKFAADSNGNIVITADNIGALAANGGKSTANISLTRNVEDSYLGLYGGTTHANSAGLELCGPEHPYLPSGFYLRARNNSSNIALTGDTNGNLKWNNRDITLGYPNYAAGTTTTASSYTAAADGWITIEKLLSGSYIAVKINNVLVAQGGGSDYDRSSFCFPVKKGDVIATFAATLVGVGAALEATIVFYPNR